ncbi:hypothetical protein A3D88_00485 [Candidatus Peribacteria bacterium RIFCSPHIGHO2_02_FULL_52_16]|nr:MAG: hypothetical protein A2706_01440 [Candidatus Peribacteria bacterium RIFCSPHIGHO2_01_FULL_51_35]OGJ61951.1 MAG: hypothetical protein A3D88_00485 [Candidatus Peribacteria bacterium RIFCSPHIGHO2_02_FULL_52_16]
MDIALQTGHTKSSTGESLVSLSLTSERGEHACLLLQIGASPKDAKTLEEECTTIVKHALLDSEGDSWSRLDGTLKEMNGLFKGLLVSETVQDIHALLAIMDTKKMLHVSHAGRAEAYLIRGGQTSQITEYSKGKPNPVFVHISSGQLEARDIVVCSTQRLLRTVTPAQLSQLSQRGDQLLDEIIIQLDAEREHASVATLHIPAKNQRILDDEPAARPALSTRRSGHRRSSASILARFTTFLPALTNGLRTKLPRTTGVSNFVQELRERFASFLTDLKHPERKRRAHLLLLASAVAAFLIIWMVVRLSTSSQRSKTRAELEDLVSKINTEIRTADNRRLTGDIDSANAILQQAEERAKQVMDNESGLFRVEALDLLDRIRSKREEINNIIRLPPRLVVNIGAKNPDVEAQGIIGVGDGEFTVYDRQDLHRVLLNSVDDPDRLSDEELIMDGAGFSRYKSLVFLTTGNSVIEMIANQPTTMKTEDTAGWKSGNDIETYLRFLYVLSPEKNQIYKYERLSNRYGPPVEYNVNGTLGKALDMVIDSSVFVLNEGGTVLKLLRGEVQPFVIRHAPDNVLADATKLFKVTDSNIYFLDPKKARVIVTTDGGATGESSYVKQYVFEGEQIGTLQDLFVDPDQTHLYVLDEKRLYVVDLATK